MKEVNDKTFKELVVETGGKALLVCGTAWCNATTNLLGRVLRGYVGKYRGSVRFLYAEIEGEEIGVKKNPKIHAELHVSRYPTILAFLDGRFVAQRISEVWSKQAEDVESLLRQLEVTD